MGVMAIKEKKHYTTIGRHYIAMHYQSVISTISICILCTLSSHILLTSSLLMHVYAISVKVTRCSFEEDFTLKEIPLEEEMLS